VINRQAYLDLSKVVEAMVVVPALPIGEVKSIVLRNGLELFRSEDDVEPSRMEPLSGTTTEKSWNWTEPARPRLHCDSILHPTYDRAFVLCPLNSHLHRKAATMLLRLRNVPRVLVLLVLIQTMSSAAHAASCTTQSQMTAPQRDDLTSSARTLLTEMQTGNIQAMQANTIPAVAADFSGIAASVQNLKPLLQNASFTVNNIYILDASTESVGAPRTDFFCGQPVVTLNFSDLPAGTYALAIGHATGVPQPQQISLILAKLPQDKWMLAGLFSKSMVLVGHDGIWYWSSARKYAEQNMNWDAWFYYRAASYLLNPLDMLSSLNLERFNMKPTG